MRGFWARVRIVAINLEPLYARFASRGGPNLSALDANSDDTLKFLGTGNRFSTVARGT